MATYLKTKQELKNDIPSIKCSAITAQQDASNECGALCLYVIYNLPFSQILDDLQKTVCERQDPSSNSSNRKE